VGNHPGRPDDQNAPDPAHGGQDPQRRSRHIEEHDSVERKQAGEKIARYIVSPLDQRISEHWLSHARQLRYPIGTGK